MGTEAPDMSESSIRLRFTYIDDNNQEVEIFCQGFGASDKLYHNIYFYPDNPDAHDPYHPGDPQRMKPKPSQNTAVNKAEYCEQKAKEYLQKGYCEAAAFYMGAMTHYIADCASFCHVITTTDFPDPQPTGTQKDDIHENFEDLIFDGTKNHYVREPKDCFIYPKNIDIEATRPKQPEPTVSQCALCLAFDTRWDCQLTAPAELNYYSFPFYVLPGPKNATWLYQNFQNLQNIEVEKWNTLNPEFKYRVQQNLDLAIICCAKAINALGNYWILTEKECRNCTDKSNPDKAQTTLTQFGWVALAVSLILFIGISNAIGIPLFQIMAYIYAEKPIPM